MHGRLKPLASCCCILAISDDMCLKATRDILYNMKITNFEIVRDGGAAIFSLRKSPFVDFVICQDDVPVGGCLSVLKFVRFDRGFSRSNLPVLAIGSSWTHEKIGAYRDAGVSDILSFPVSQYSMQRRILSSIYSERQFVSTEGYCGPDRRHRNDPGYMGPFRRFTDVIAQKITVHRKPAAKPPAAPESRPAPPPQPPPSPLGAMSQEELAKMLGKK